MKSTAFLLPALAAICAGGTFAADSVKLLNVSYDPTRELYQNFNFSFVSVNSGIDRCGGLSEFPIWQPSGLVRMMTLPGFILNSTRSAF